MSFIHPLFPRCPFFSLLSLSLSLLSNRVGGVGGVVCRRSLSFRSKAESSEPMEGTDCVHAGASERASGAGVGVCFAFLAIFLSLSLSLLLLSFSLPLVRSSQIYPLSHTTL